MPEVGFEIPANDPCWYCHCPPGDDLVFSWEFDTFVHLGCIRDRLSSDPTDREAAILGREFGLPGAPPAPTWDADERAAIEALPDVDAMF